MIRNMMGLLTETPKACEGFTVRLEFTISAITIFQFPYIHNGQIYGLKRGISVSEETLGTIQLARGLKRWRH